LQNSRISGVPAGAMASLSAIPAPLESRFSERYRIDPSISRFTVRAFASGLLSVLGHSPTIAVGDFEGDVLLEKGSLESAALHLRVKAASLLVQDDVSNRDRLEIERQMRDEVLETGRFPDILYKCSSASGSEPAAGPSIVRLNGQLSLHGVARPLPIDAHVNVTGDLLRASGEISLRQTDYDIRLVSAMAGALKIKDELKVSFDIAARKQKQE
jgi:polyisoprenoid-binding protein YceI